MATAAFLALIALGLTACNRESNDQRAPLARASHGSAMPAPLQKQIIAEVQRRQTDTLAYEHIISIELSKALLPARVREIQEACAADKQFGCTLLDVAIQNSDDVPSGTIRMRLAPGGVGSFIQTASRDGKITASTTHAEDLADQVTDTERELSLLTAHRDRMTEFLKDKSLKIDQVITLSRELASVQTQIDSAGTTRANLHRRIDTELLTINIAIPRQIAAEQRTPIRDAVSSFFSEFTGAVGQVIQFVAVLIPWLFVIIPGLVLVRLFWRWIGRWLARSEAR